MSRVYTCVKCNTAMGTEVSFNPYCSTCRVEQALSKQSSRNSYSESYEEQITHALSRILQELRERGLP